MVVSRTMKRWEIINTLLSKCNGKRYLEIGLNKGECFGHVTCDYKVSVDPDPKCHASFVMTSDEFFYQFKGDPFDVVFLDGLHEHNQLEEDILNALKILSPNGFIVCHDCNPQNEIEQRVPRETKRWNGDCWKAIVYTRTKSELIVHTVDADEGCAVIHQSNGVRAFLSPLKPSDLTYTNMEKNRKLWLNLIDISQFVKIYG